ncbi:unnamed protein product [Rotaria sordida]|uniref:G-protein coupled receptors family 1 profile domain-containing protein n=1 Tax=Rotaria sordida TaxID=392033 RepID=A0A814EHW6_9BILA|nr:unnamed protein product [Rotaria sordida]CAF3860284.1 unnamed protein product [Rotaria sordida]
MKPTLYNIIFSIYVFIIVGVAPPLLMIIFSLITLRNIRLAHRRIRPALTFTGMHQRDYQLTRMLVSEVVVYILSTLPFPFNSLYNTVTISIAKSVDRQIIEAFINFITGTFLIFINPSSTFYIYLTTSKTFRSEVKAAFNNIGHQIFRVPQRPRLPTMSKRTTTM